MKFHTRQSVLAGLLLVAMGAMFAACGGDDSAAPEDDGPFTGTIHILDNRFSPASVTISVGDSVTWRWEGGNFHTVTHGTSPASPPDPQKLFDTPAQDSGTFGYRFTDPGTVPYLCRLHVSMGMTGTITVQP